MLLETKCPFALQSNMDLTHFALERFSERTCLLPRPRLSATKPRDTQTAQGLMHLQTEPVTQPWGQTALCCKAVRGHLTPVSPWHYWE